MAQLVAAQLLIILGLKICSIYVVLHMARDLEEIRQEFGQTSTTSVATSCETTNQEELVNAVVAQVLARLN